MRWIVVMVVLVLVEIRCMCLIGWVLLKWMWLVISVVSLIFFLVGVLKDRLCDVVFCMVVMIFGCVCLSSVGFYDVMRLMYLCFVVFVMVVFFVEVRNWGVLLIDL